MATYKVICTLTWKLDSQDDHEETLKFAKKQLDEILNSRPEGDDFDGFAVQMDLAKMKDRKRLIHVGSFELEDVFPYVAADDSKREYAVGDRKYSVRMNSDRYHVFKKNHCCIACGLAGSKMMLDLNPGDNTPHFNMYGEEHGRLVLMTKDHILAKSKGGKDEPENFVTCCAVCNNLKGDYPLSYEQVRELRRLHDNVEKLPHKELRDLINETRQTMAEVNACEKHKLKR